MELLTDSLRETVSKLSEDQREEVDVIESIINTNEINKENTKEKVFRFLEKRKPENCANFFIEIIKYAIIIRPKEKESINFILTSCLSTFHSLQGEEPPDSFMYIFKSEEKETVEKVIFDDNIESLQQLLAIRPDEGKERIMNVCDIMQNCRFKINEINRIEAAALFGSIKCFKYLMMNDDVINEITCRYAVIGGNIEIIHICEQKGLKFDDCLIASVYYHRFEIFEWLNTHFNYNEIQLSDFVMCYNEPLFYFNSLAESKVETLNEGWRTPINDASRNGCLEVVKYLYETCHANVETKDNINGRTPINDASRNGHLEVVKYLYETCHADVETKDKDGFTPINSASYNGHLEVVKYLYETCHADVETKDKFGHNPITIAAIFDNQNVVNYLKCLRDVKKDK